jgi:hypothetical protein
VRTQVVRKPNGDSSALFNIPNFNCSTFNNPKLECGPNVAAEILEDEYSMKHVILRKFDSYTDKTIAVSQLEAKSTISAKTSRDVNNAFQAKLASSTKERKEIYRTICLRELISQT